MIGLPEPYSATKAVGMSLTPNPGDATATPAGPDTIDGYASWKGVVPGPCDRTTGAEKLMADSPSVRTAACIRGIVPQNMVCTGSATRLFSIGTTKLMYCMLDCSHRWMLPVSSSMRLPATKPCEAERTAFRLSLPHAYGATADNETDG